MSLLARPITIGADFTLLPDKGQTQTSVTIFYGGQFTLSTLWLIIYFSVSLSHQRSTQFLSKQNPQSYNIIVNCQYFPPLTAERRLIECKFNTQNRQKIYSLPFEVNNKAKMPMFQHKIVHNIMYVMYK